MTEKHARVTAAELDALLRVLAVTPATNETADLDPELLEAYLAGQTSPKQSLRLQKVFAQSGDAREELLGLAAVSQQTLEFQTLPMPHVPPRRRRPLVGIDRRLILGLAAVLAIAFGLPYGLSRSGGSQTTLLLIPDRAYHGEQFEVVQTRGVTPLLTLSPQTHREAALLAFRQVVRWSEGDVAQQAYPPSLPPAAGLKHFELRTERGRYEVNFPADAAEARLAILRLPSLELSWAPLPEEVGSGRLPKSPSVDTPDQVLVALAYRTSQGFAAVLAHPR